MNTTNRKNLFATLQQFARSENDKPGEAEFCEFCSQPLAPKHRYLLELANHRIICACDPCALHFQDVAEGRFRLIPRDVMALPDFHMEDAQWEELALPINLAFFFVNGDTGKTAMAYPSPAGATESPLAIANWQALSRTNPELYSLKPDVEALLAHRVGATREYFIAPIDVCFELTGLIRRHWRGLSGGAEVWGEIDRFFARLREEAIVLSSAHSQELYA